MPDTKTYVEVAKISVKETFDPRYKTKFPEFMLTLTEKLIEKSRKLTTKKPSGRKTEGFYVDGALELTKTETDGAVQVEAKIKFVIATWPKKSMFGFGKGKASIPVARIEKIDGDVAYLVKELVTDIVQKQVIKTIEKRAE